MNDKPDFKKMISVELKESEQFESQYGRVTGPQWCEFETERMKRLGRAVEVRRWVRSYRSSRVAPNGYKWSGVTKDKMVAVCWVALMILAMVCNGFAQVEPSQSLNTNQFRIEPIPMLSSWTLTNPVPDKCWEVIAWDGVKWIILLPDASTLKDSCKTAFTHIHEMRGSVSTNWADGGGSRTLMGWIGDVDPNYTTHHQSGTVVSNTFAVVRHLDGETMVLIRSVSITNLHRNYVVERRRIYSDGTIEVIDRE